MRWFKLAGVAVLLAQSLMLPAQTVSIQFAGSAFTVTGWRATATPPAQGWASIFAVYAGAGDAPSLLGTYTVEAGSLVFRPRFPIAAGVHYRAIFRLPGGGPPIEREFDGPLRDTVPAARVDHIYPSADVLPSNQLRLYVYFSAPMSRGEADRRIHLLDASGKVLPGVFLPGEELWDPNNQRLTMTFDPGRIKRGLTSNTRMGPPIAEGARYKLVIDQGWHDARGVPMVRGMQKLFRGGAAVRTPPDPNQWRVTAPKAASADALIVDFPRPMNYPLLMRMLQVSSSHDRIAGTVTIGRDETEWRFTPEKPWTAGNYQLVVDTAIEDLAGNHIGQAFDIDVFEHVTEHIASKTVSIPFNIH